MNNTQMELNFTGKLQLQPAKIRRRRLPNAGWWFTQIRRIINTPDATIMPRQVQGRLALTAAS
jgi:hypothetical protein